MSRYAATRSGNLNRRLTAKPTFPERKSEYDPFVRAAQKRTSDLPDDVRQSFTPVARFALVRLDISPGSSGQRRSFDERAGRLRYGSTVIEAGVMSVVICCTKDQQTPGFPVHLATKGLGGTPGILPWRGRACSPFYQTAPSVTHWLNPGAHGQSDLKRFKKRSIRNNLARQTDGRPSRVVQ
jgi:hypothetical protein